MVLPFALLVACGGGDGDGVAATGGDSRALSAADLVSIRSAVEAVREVPTGRYELVQSLRAPDGEQSQALVTRKGSYDRGERLHQVEVQVPGRGGEEPVQLTFLTTPGDVLMRNPTFTKQHGRPWNRLPAEALAAFGADPTAAAVEPPALEVAASAQTPGRVLAAKAGVVEYEVAVTQTAAIELFANAGAVKLSQLTGLPPEDLAAAFPGTLPATVVLTQGGALASMRTDLRPLLQRAAEVAIKPVEGLDKASLLVEVTWQPGAPVAISVPAPAEIGDFPE